MSCDAGGFWKRPQECCVRQQNKFSGALEGDFMQIMDEIYSSAPELHLVNFLGPPSTPFFFYYKYLRDWQVL